MEPPLQTSGPEISKSPENLQHNEANAAASIPPIEPTNPKGPPTSASSTRPTPPPRSRTPSHTLLHTSLNAPMTSRKSRFVDAGTTEGNTGRASISMPPPANKPPAYKPLVSRQPSHPLPYQSGAVKEGKPACDVDRAQSLDHKTTMAEKEHMSNNQTQPTSEPCSPLPPDSTLKPPVPSTGIDSDGNRLSFPSLYSLGSAIYNGTIGAQSAPASTASSNAGSIRSGTFDPTPAPLSPTRLSTRSELSAPVTTATDPVSVTANAYTQHQGSCLARFGP